MASSEPDLSPVRFAPRVVVTVDVTGCMSIALAVVSACGVWSRTTLKGPGPRLMAEHCPVLVKSKSLAEYLDPGAICGKWQSPSVKSNGRHTVPEAIRNIQLV